MLGLTLVYKYEIAETLVTIRVYDYVCTAVKKGCRCTTDVTPAALITVARCIHAHGLVVVAGPWTYRTIRRA